MANVLSTTAFLVLLSAATSVAQQATGVPHAADLSAPRVDKLDNGEIVVTLAASGELKGLVTFRLRQAADSTVNGDWAFTVAHVDGADPASGIEPEQEHGHGDHEHPHRDFVTMVHRGSLAGTLSGVQLSFDSAGALTDIFASLTIAQGSSEFEGATGSGRATLSALTLFF